MSVENAPRVGEIGRARASMGAVEVLTRIRESARRFADDNERESLAQWSGWGPLAPLFTPKTESWARMAEQAGELLSEHDLKEGMQGTYNAFFTPAALARSMWDLLAGLGFTGGAVAELGCGAGAFIATAPAGVTVTGIERDPTSAAIAKLLHPEHRIIASRLEATPLPATFGAVIGNIPFGDVKVFDPSAPKDSDVTRSLHNYFVWRAVSALAPGGLAVLLTSRFTLDARDEGARADIGQLADFVGAIRLPAGGLEGGTQVVADIVVLRRKVPGVESRGVDWLTTTSEPFGWEHPVSGYWSQRPAQVLGSMVKGKTERYGLGITVEPIPGESAAEGVQRVAATVIADAQANGLSWVQPTVVSNFDPTEHDVVSAEGWLEDSYHFRGDDLLVVRHGTANPVRPASGRTPAGYHELVTLVKLRDQIEGLVAAEADHDRPDAKIEPLRKATAAAYRAYVKRFGFLHRGTTYSKGIDTESGVEQFARRVPTMGGFRHDPGAALVFALEMWDEEEQRGEPAQILTSRQNRKVVRPQRAADAQQALAWCLDRVGKVDLTYVGKLLGMVARSTCDRCRQEARAAPGSTTGWVHTPGADHDHPVDAVTTDEAGLHRWVASQLGDAVFQEPGYETWLTAEEYLAGDVRAKYAAASTAAIVDARYQRNADALKKALPRWLGPGEIIAALGTPWIGPKDIQRFTIDLFGFGAGATVRHLKASNRWELEGGSRLSTAATETWGTPDVNGYQLIELALNGKSPEVRRSTGKNSSKKDDELSLQAAEAQQRIKERFRTWVWEDGERCERLVTLYNTRFNCLVTRTYNGEHITVQGMAPDWAAKMYPHQKEFIARMLATPATLCGHPVGAGKSLTMTAGAIKLRQVGLVDKPMLVVPNHLIEQADAGARQMFPAAKILSSSAETIRKNRRAFTARVATQPWDLVIITQSAFDVMPVHAATEQAYLELQKQDLHRSLIEADPDGKLKGRNAKDMAKKLARIDAEIRELRHRAHGPDGGVTFEQLGVRWIGIDEAHAYKNLAVPCYNEGFTINPSKRATHLDMIVRWLAGQGSGRYAALFTGTPVSNTMLELYIMQQYLMPEYLASIGLNSADAWVAANVEMVTKVGVTVNGGSFEIQTRPARFINAPELRVLFSMVADIRTAEALGLKRPQIDERVIKVQPTLLQEMYSDDLVSRAKALKGVRFPEPGADNMLKVCNDGRWMATDPALVGLDDDEPGKLHAVANEVIRIWREHPKELQLVFCDVGTPNDKKGTQTYGRLAQILVDMGMPRRLIEFAHTAKSDADKAAQFRRARNGPMTVLMGSTAKLGTGTNVQDRVVAMHHVDAPYTPSGVEQRDGRGARPGNRNACVYNLRYVTARTFDAYLWQMLVRKLTFISQLMSGTLDRSVEDCATEQLMSFSAVQASATDQPLLLERADVEATVNRLRTVQAGHRQMQQRQRHQIPKLRAKIDERDAERRAWEAIRASDAPSDIDEATALRLHEAMTMHRYSGRNIKLGGLAVTFGSWVTATSEQREPLMYVDGGGGQVTDRLYRSYKPETVAERVLKVVAKAGAAAPVLANTLVELRRELAEKEALLLTPFEQEDELTAALARLDQIDAGLKKAASGKTDVGDADSVLLADLEDGALVDLDTTMVPDRVAGVAPIVDEDDVAAAVDDDRLAEMADVFGSLMQEFDDKLEREMADAMAVLGL